MAKSFAINRNIHGTSAVRRKEIASPGPRVIIIAMAKHVIHISELEGASHFAALLARLRAGEEIVIEDDSRPVAIVHPAEPSLRLLSESLRLAREHGSTKTLDEDFGRDVEAGIASHHKALEPPKWD